MQLFLFTWFDPMLLYGYIKMYHLGVEKKKQELRILYLNVVVFFFIAAKNNCHTFMWDDV